MHLLAAQPGSVTDGSEAVDLNQTPGEIIVISAADMELTLLAEARAERPVAAFPSLRLANLMHLAHNMSVDIYVESIIAKARLVIVRALGGRGYWPYGCDEVSAICQERKIPLAFLPGDDQPDAELASLSTVDRDVQHRLWQYLVHGGPGNALDFIDYAAFIIGYDTEWTEPRPLVRAGLHWPGIPNPDLDSIRSSWTDESAIAALVFYRALIQSGNICVVEAMVDGLREAGLNPLPIFVSSLKDPVAAATLETIMSKVPPSIILNATGFAISAPGQKKVPGPFDLDMAPMVLQIVFSGGNKNSWLKESRGLSPRDIAMNVALPEVDGRILTRAVSFKDARRRDDLTQTDLVRYEPVKDRIQYVCRLAASWVSLRQTPISERRFGLILANYPNRDGRLGNGVGLDTPASVIQVLKAMKNEGYGIGAIPVDGQALIRRVMAAPTNAFENLDQRLITETISKEEYNNFFFGLSDAVQEVVLDRWGPPEKDPFFFSHGIYRDNFAIPAFRLGNVAICLQPARGYNINPKESYHSPDLVPPHNYLAFYIWLRKIFQAHGLVHLGKHGNLEWLPGKALALSENCFPEIALGPLPNIYPFIVNDPGEGTQAKRRTSAVIIDHLTPPLTRAESYGPLKDLEQLVDEYYEASGFDPRRLKVLARDILELCQAIGLDEDCGIEADDTDGTALNKLDNYLCNLKEMQIRDGLHVFGESPDGDLLNDLLVALVRVPRNSGENGDASLHRALADDLKLGLDPLNSELAKPWTGPRPEILVEEEPWRTFGDTVERIEKLAAKIVAGEVRIEKKWTRTLRVLDNLNMYIRPLVQKTGQLEIDGVLGAMGGQFVPPGASGAPTRGRLDVLPTGRNFYSVDTRTVPTPAAWKLGWKSAGLLVERYMQDHGAWPRVMALTAWGTSNMRTGGDDIAQGLALMGVQPTWDASSRRVNGFEIMPANVLGRPRIDVTMRVSGFFRDAFPDLIDLFDSAARAVSGLDEPKAINPAAQQVLEETVTLVASGLEESAAATRAGYRVFGSKPGAYGAGLQALMDEKGWESDADLARAYLAWGGYAYGSGAEGAAEHGLFETRLKTVQAVIQNQDNREHDLLDSDDYYQFEGGVTAAVRHYSGSQPEVYHMDHAQPDEPRVRTLEEEIARVVRARVVNPKWIAGVMRHGYKGAFEIAATVDYIVSFQATARCVKDHHFDAVFDAYLGDDKVLDFLLNYNPQALQDMIGRLLEAQERGLWRPRRNDTQNLLNNLRECAQGS